MEAKYVYLLLIYLYDMDLDFKVFIETELGFTPVKLAIIGVLWVFVFIAMGLDLISGLRKAKRAGIATQSELLRRTTDKIIKNYTALTFMLMFDVLFFWVTNYFDYMDLCIFPLPSIAMAMFEIYVEYKSYRENITDKLRHKDNEAVKELLDLATMFKEKKILDNLEELNNGED